MGEGATLERYRQCMGMPLVDRSTANDHKKDAHVLLRCCSLLERCVPSPSVVLSVFGAEVRNSGEGETPYYGKMFHIEEQESLCFLMV